MVAEEKMNISRTVRLDCVRQKIAPGALYNLAPYSLSVAPEDHEGLTLKYSTPLVCLGLLPAQDLLWLTLNQ